MDLPEIVHLINVGEVAPQQLAHVRKLRDAIPGKRCGEYGHTNRAGEPCGLWAIKGTTACKRHGGHTPVVRAKADRVVGEQVLEQLKQMVPKALARIEQIIDDPTDDKVALAAARDILDRAGHSAVHKVEAGTPGSFDGVDQRIEDLLSRGRSTE